MYTEIVPYTSFTLAEDYHQKYGLLRDSLIMKEMQAIYPDITEFINSTAVARLN